MFTGIVQGTAHIIDIVEKQNLRKLFIQLPNHLTNDIHIGASVAVDGCCLTITSHDQQIVTFDVIEETLNLTTLSQRQIGDKVNIERSLKFGDEIGGHVMSGHISCVGIINEINKSETNCKMTIVVPKKFSKYIFYKGFIGIDGASLTIGGIDSEQFNINLIPETLALTNLNYKKVNDKVNIEFDTQTQTIVDTIERYMKKTHFSE